MRGLLIVLLALAGFARPGDAAAQSCTATQPDGLYFGNTTTPVPAINVTVPITIECTGTGPQTLLVCLGIRPSTTFFFGSRLLVHPSWSAAVPYEIYTNPARTQVWDTSPRQPLTVTLDQNGNGSATINAYARINGGGSPPAGAYNSEIIDDRIEGGISSGGNCTGGTRGTFTGRTFNASLFLDGSCVIQADPLDFGNVMGSIATNIDAVGAVRATCNSGLPYTIALSGGGHEVAGQRRMRDGSEYVSYDLYSDAGRSQRWGDGAPDPVLVGTGTGVEQPIPVYGRVPSGQAVGSGTYTDTVTATITY
jgi:spore coat protein U-like protein